MPLNRDSHFPSGTQGSEFLDARIYDEDADAVGVMADMFDDDNNDQSVASEATTLRTEGDFRRRAAEVYAEYATQYKSRFKWLRHGLFIETLAQDFR